jgi:hypothetical protein
MPSADIVSFAKPTKQKRQPKPRHVELQSLFGGLRPLLRKLTVLIDLSFVDDLSLGEVDGPDAELIQQCSRLLAIQVARNTLWETIPEERSQDILFKLIDPKWREIRDRIIKLGGPRTVEGCQGMALVLMDQFPEGLGEIIKEKDIIFFLAFRCAEFLLRAEDG